MKRILQKKVFLEGKVFFIQNLNGTGCVCNAQFAVFRDNAQMQNVKWLKF